METSQSVLPSPPASPPASVDPLPPAALCRTCDPATLDFQTTDDLKPPDESIGQARAIEAIRFGAGIAHRGYNVFVLGPPGVGRHTVVREFLEKRAKEMATPPDWAYVWNFAEPHRPRALRLPAGRGRPLRMDLKKLTEEMQQALPAMFESDEYRARHQALDKEIEQRREQALGALGDRAEQKGLALVRTPGGLVIVPTRAGHVIEPDEFQALPDDVRDKAQQEMKALSEDLSQLLAKLPAWAREHREKIRGLRRELTQQLVHHHLAEVRAKNADLPT